MEEAVALVVRAAARVDAERAAVVRLRVDAGGWVADTGTRAHEPPFHHTCAQRSPVIGFVAFATHFRNAAVALGAEARYGHTGICRREGERGSEKRACHPKPGRLRLHRPRVPPSSTHRNAGRHGAVLQPSQRKAAAAVAERVGAVADLERRPRRRVRRVAHERSVRAREGELSADGRARRARLPRAAPVPRSDADGSRRGDVRRVAQGDGHTRRTRVEALRKWEVSAAGSAGPAHTAADAPRSRRRTWTPAAP